MLSKSSSLGLSESLKGQERILEILRMVGGKTYLNSPGGRHLYDKEKFSELGFCLRFLAPYEGEWISSLEAISTI